MSSSFLPYANASISEKNIKAVTDSLRKSGLTKTDAIKQFEKTLANYCEAKYAVAFSSGTAAKMAAYHAASLTSLDWVITTPNTFISTVAAAIQARSRIHLIDIDRQTGAMDINLLREKFKLRTSRGRPIIVPCHFAGIPTNVQTIDSLICHPDAITIEDATYAFGSCYSDGKRVGCCAFSQMTVFSFCRDKLITTGEGGLVTTNDEKTFHQLQIYRNNGIDDKHKLKEPWFYEYQAISGNFNLTSFQAALGLSQFQEIDHFMRQRRLLVNRYHHHLKNIPSLTLLTEAGDTHTAFQLFVVQIDFSAFQTNREEVMKKLHSKGIATAVHYIPLYKQPLLKYCLDCEVDYPEMEKYYEQTLTLPLYSNLKEEEVDYICDTLKECLKMPRRAPE